MTELPSTSSVPAKLLSAARKFIAIHGKSARAVVEHLGGGKARVVLVAPDGVVGDVIAPTMAIAQDLIAAIPELIAAQWDQQTVAAARIGAAHRRKMAGK